MAREERKLFYFSGFNMNKLEHLKYFGRYTYCVERATSGYVRNLFDKYTYKKA